MHTLCIGIKAKICVSHNSYVIQELNNESKVKTDENIRRILAE